MISKSNSADFDFSDSTSLTDTGDAVLPSSWRFLFICFFCTRGIRDDFDEGVMQMEEEEDIATGITFGEISTTASRYIIDESSEPRTECNIVAET